MFLRICSADVHFLLSCVLAALSAGVDSGIATATVENGSGFFVNAQGVCIHPVSWRVSVGFAL